MSYIGTPLTTSAELTRTRSGSIRSIRFASTLRLLLPCGTPGGCSIVDKFPGNLGNLRGLGRGQRRDAERSRERKSGGGEVSVLLKDDTGNDVPGGQIHEMQAVSNL